MVAVVERRMKIDGLGCSLLTLKVELAGYMMTKLKCTLLADNNRAFIPNDPLPKSFISKT